jgi:hypothetical protein
MEPREFVDIELKLIQRLFSIQKEVYPMVVLVKNDDRYQIPVQFQNAAHKDIVSQGIKDLVKRSEPDVVIYMAEAWVKVIKTKFDRIITSITPADLEKFEIVCVQIEFKSGEKYSAEAKIIREDRKVKLEPFEFMNVDMSMGRFMDFFPIGKTN